MLLLCILAFQILKRYPTRHWFDLIFRVCIHREVELVQLKPLDQIGGVA